MKNKSKRKIMEVVLAFTLIITAALFSDYINVSPCNGVVTLGSEIMP